MRFNEFNSSNLVEGFQDPGIFKAIFLAGPPGAGKNLIIKALGLKAAGLKLQDTDHTLAYLNRARTPLNKLQYNDSGYEYSLQTTQRRQTVLQKEMLGLIINTTGRDYESLMELKELLEKMGYDTFMLFVDVDKDVAWERAQDRSSNATDPKDQRPVDRKYFEIAYSGAKQNADFYAMKFGDRFVAIENNVSYGPHDPRGNLVSQHSKRDLNKLIQTASKKINKFLNKPLSPLARSVVLSLKRDRGLE